jgi:hypothetical protein
MDALQTLAVALGLATLAGLNLYLTVFVTGLAINQHWIELLPKYQQLDVLGEPVVIAIAGALYFIEFFADKVPWVDSLWDSIHTIIRPIGGALLAIRVLGPTSPAFDVIVALLAGSVTLIAHGAKAGTRLVANSSPEPFSNIALSLGEDAVVLAGLALIHWNPIVALVVFVLLLGTVVMLAPRLFRGVRLIVWLAWKKLQAPAAEADPPLSTELSADHDLLFSRLNLLGEKIAWAVPCISGGALPANSFGALIATLEEPRKLYFVAKRRLGKIAATLDLEGYKVTTEPKFLSHNLVLYGTDRQPRYVFVFERPRAAVARKVAESIRERLERTVPSGSEPPAENPPFREPAGALAR